MDGRGAVVVISLEGVATVPCDEVVCYLLGEVASVHGTAGGEDAARRYVVGVVRAGRAVVGDLDGAAGRGSVCKCLAHRTVRKPPGGHSD